MKRLQSEVKAASEKQQTYAHHRESEGERWRRRVETESERHLAKDNLISPQKNPHPHLYSKRVHLKLHCQNLKGVTQSFPDI